MKTYLLLIILLTTLAFAYSEDKANTAASFIVPAKGKELEAEGVIKAAKGLCIGDKCKDKWPSLKCAEYDNRPKGESGDAYCQSLGKACSSVLLSGSGAPYFNECSGTPITPHKTRCCWIE